MTFRLTKHHGLGNDFLVLLGPASLLAEVGPDRARAWCDRRRGIGADGLLLGTTEPLEPGTDRKQAEAEIGQIAQDVLVNPVIEEYRIEFVD